jgi:hypothetical protein
MVPSGADDLGEGRSPTTRGIVRRLESASSAHHAGDVRTHGRVGERGRQPIFPKVSLDPTVVEVGDIAEMNDVLKRRPTIGRRPQIGSRCPNQIRILYTWT